MTSNEPSSRQGALVLWAEVDPPKGVYLGDFVTAARSFEALGLTVVVTDSSQAVMRMTPLWPCRELIRAGIAPVMVLGGRDRNRLSFQGDLLAAASMGVKEVLLTRGTPLAQGDQHLAGSAGDLDLPLMLDCVARIGRGEDLGGARIDEPAELRAGVLLEPTNDPARNQQGADAVGRLAELGASCVVLGPTYDLGHVELFAEAASRAGVPLYSSLMWLRSIALVRYWNRLPDTARIPERVLEQMLKAKGRPEQALACALELFGALRERCAGVVLTAPGWEGHLSSFLEGVRRGAGHG